jgi:hypothetical protein
MVLYKKDHLMKKLYQLSLSFFILGALISCTGESVSTSNQEHEEGPFYVEFVSCSKGSEYSNSNLSDMIQSWRMLPISNELRGSYLYDPIKEENAFGPSMWWELEWESKEAADSAWNEWVTNADVMEWTNKYQDVMSCDGAGRNAWDIKIPVSSSYFGESNDSGYFYSQYWTCSYKNGAGRNELDTFLPMHSAKIKSSNLEGTGYHYGVYFDRRSRDASHSDVPANLVWGEWAKSEEAMEKQNQNFENNFQEVFAAFDKLATCLDEPDTFNSWMLYSRDNSDYSPSF